MLSIHTILLDIWPAAATTDTRNTLLTHKHSSDNKQAAWMAFRMQLYTLAMMSIE